MRVIADIPHEACKITVFAWNGKYIIKMEKGLMEQTYKIEEFELGGTEDIKRLLDDTFINQVLERFNAMRTDFGTALSRM
jgi:hypothetical protein